MKTKLVLWGSNTTEEKILIAMRLRADDNKVDIWTFPEAVATDEFARQLLGDWRNDVEVPFPESATLLERELSMTDSLLPEEIKVERGDIVQRAQTEWHFVVLSSKLNEVYQTELAELKGKVAGLTAFSNDAWNELKSFWAKVQNQVRERNLLRGHADALRDDTNSLFSKLKELRSALDEEFRVASQKHHEKFMAILTDLEKRANEGTRLPALFDELKELQRSFREIKLTREHRSRIWERLDATFKVVKEKRFGPNANNESSALDRLNRRYNGLLGAIEKMQRSIARDEDDLKFQQRKIDSSDGQLEAQIRQAKIKMTHERIRSKNEKLKEMLQTRTELEKRIAIQKDKESKRNKQGEIAAAKALAKQKIAQSIAAAAVARKDEDDKLEKAAEAIVATEEVATETIEETVETTKATAEVVTETVEETVETTKAAAEVATETVEETVETTKAAAEVATETVEETAETTKAAAEVATETVKETVETTKAAAEVATETVKETVETTKAAAEVATETIETTVETTKAAAEVATETIETTVVAEVATETIEETVEETVAAETSDELEEIVADNAAITEILTKEDVEG